MLAKATCAFSHIPHARKAVHKADFQLIASELLKLMHARCSISMNYRSSNGH